MITYLRMLDASPDGADWLEVSRIVLHIDAEREPDRALGARHRALPVVISCDCTGIIRCSLGFPGYITKGCVASLTSTSRG